MSSPSGLTTEGGNCRALPVIDPLGTMVKLAYTSWLGEVLVRRERTVAPGAHEACNCWNFPVNVAASKVENESGKLYSPKPWIKEGVLYR